MSATPSPGDRARLLPNLPGILILTVGSRGYTAAAMSIRVATSEKKAEIARDVVVAYLSHMKDEDLKDLDTVEQAIGRLIDVVDRSFDVSERAQPGFGMSPTIPAPGR